MKGEGVLLVEGGRTKAGITPSSTILSMPFP